MNDEAPHPGDIAKKIRRLGFEPSPDLSPYNRGYLEAVDMAARIAEDLHTIIECSNARCSSSVRGWHCWECDEIDQDYDAEHLRTHATDPDFPKGQQ